MNQEQFVAELAKLRTSSTFLTLKGYRAESGEIADYNIVFHMSYKNALLRSLAVLESIVPSDALEAQAKKELTESFMTSLDKIETTPIEEIDDAYRRFTDSDGQYIKGVKLHEETNTLHLYGLVVQKKVLMPGVYKKVNSKPLTIAKDKLRRQLPVSKFRQFKITPDQVDSVSVENLSLLPPE
jgi:hypothetical protein